MIKMLGFWGASKPYYKWGDGIATQGDQFTIVNDLDLELAAEADCFYQTNMIKPKFLREDQSNYRGRKYLFMANQTKPVLVSESSPFRQYGQYLRFGWHSYGWTDANCNNDDVSNDRWNKFEKNTGITIKDWHSPGDYILLMGQKEGDSALMSLFNSGKNFDDWILETIIEIRKHTDRKIKYRPHPRTAYKGVKLLKNLLTTHNLKNVELTDNLTVGGNQGGAGLDADLKNAYCVVTYNSLSILESVINGIPVFAMDGGSMAYPIAHKDLSQIENLKYDIDLQDWKNKIAYTMWNSKEVHSGECWAHLKSVYF